MTAGVYSRKGIADASAGWRADGKKIVFTNGCFDLLHPGHTRYLKQARGMGDVLIVGINSDESVQKLKGPGRPVLSEGERAEVLLSLKWVDAVVPFSESTPLELIKAVVPHVLVKGGDWPVKEIIGGEFVESCGGEVHSLPFHPGISTSEIIGRIRGSNS